MISNTNVSRIQQQIGITTSYVEFQFSENFNRFFTSQTKLSEYQVCIHFEEIVQYLAILSIPDTIVRDVSNMLKFLEISDST